MAGRVEALCEPSSAMLTAHDSKDDDSGKTTDRKYCGDMVGAAPAWEKGANGFLYLNATGPEVAVVVGVFAAAIDHDVA